MRKRLPRRHGAIIAHPIQPPSATAGFTLLEVMVALAIAALSLAALFSGAIGGLRASHTADAVQQATALARSRLALTDAGPLAADVRTGTDASGLRWQLRIVPTGSLRLSSGLATLYSVSVVVSWGDGGTTRHVRLDSMRIGVARAEPG